MDQVSYAYCVEHCGVEDLLPVLYINPLDISLKSNSMFCVICSSSKLMPNPKPYMLTKYQYYKHTYHTQSYDIHVKLPEAGG